MRAAGSTTRACGSIDRQAYGDNNRSLYFTDQGWAGGLVFAYWKAEVRQFLIDNAGFFFDEYHVDGFRFDEVTVIDGYGGWRSLQDLTDDAAAPQARSAAHRRVLGGSVVRASLPNRRGPDSTPS